MHHRLFLDIQTVQSRFFAERGIPRYTTEVARAMLRAHGDDVDALALNPMLPFPSRLPPELADAPQLTWNTAARLRQAEARGPLLYHVLSPFESTMPMETAMPRHILGRGLPIVSTVYDLIPEITELFPPRSPEARLYALRREFLRRADLLLAISESTRRDVIERYDYPPERVVNVGASTSEFFGLPGEADRPRELLASALPALTRPFVLTVSGWAARKNPDVLIDAFGRLPEDLRHGLQLVIACNLPDEARVAWTERARRAGLGDSEVVFTDFVPDPVLRALYQQAELFVFPSQYEGFGLPVLEAARCGCPSLTSATSSLPEVLDWEPATFATEDPDGLAELIVRSLTDSAFHAQLVEVAARAATRHTWDAVVERTVEAYRLLEPPPTSRRRPPPPLRVALVGPYPPARSGVSRYNHELALRLEERCRLDVFHDRGDPPRGEPRPPILRRSRERRSRLLPAFAFGQYVDPGGYDAVIYAIGNSPWHHETFRLALRHPGIVWFHDVDLVTLYLTYAQRLVRYGLYDAAHKLVSDAIERYGGRAPIQEVSWEDNRWAGAELYGRSGVRFSSELATCGRRNIVGTDLARTMLELDAGPLAVLPPTHVVPLAPFGPGQLPSPSDDDGAEDESASEDEDLIVALGIQDLSKHPAMLIDAAVALRRTRPVRLAFVGEVVSPLREQLDARVRAHGAESFVELTGFVDDVTYREWISRATLAVQLRSESKGESSAAVYDALSGGVPVITSVAACEELPAGTVRMHEPTDVPTLAATIDELLDDPSGRARMSTAGQRHATSWSLDDVVESLLDIARDDLVVGSRA